MVPATSIADLLMRIKRQNWLQEAALIILIAALGITGLYILIMAIRALSLDADSLVRLVSGSGVLSAIYFPINKLQQILETERATFLLAIVIDKNIDKINAALIKALMDFVLKISERGRR
jgi:hypothetical protein